MNIVMQSETNQALGKIPHGTVAQASAFLGMRNGEPLIFAMDALLRYAKAYERRNEGKLSNDGVLGPCWLAAATGLRGLLNGDGAVAMEMGVSTDSKDNGVIEEIFWEAMAAAGFEEGDL